MNMPVPMQVPPPGPPPPSDQFFVSLMGQESGPYQIMQIQQMVASGQIKADTPVRTAGSQWFAVKQIPDLLT